LRNDKMPTSVLVSPAINHGGPYPSLGHPGGIWRRIDGQSTQADVKPAAAKAG
jgi:hypothetical protein